MVRSKTKSKPRHLTARPGADPKHKTKQKPVKQTSKALPNEGDDSQSSPDDSETNPVDGEDEENDESFEGVKEPREEGQTCTRAREARRPKRRKLVPPPPRLLSSLHKRDTEGSKSAKAKTKLIPVHRKENIGLFLRRVSKAFLEEGATDVELHAMGAAIPRLLTIATSLPKILPYTPQDISISYHTGSIKCTDEILLDSDNDEEDENVEDGALVQRVKSTLAVTVSLLNGVQIANEKRKAKGKSSAQKKGKAKEVQLEDLMSTDEE
ncbi:hypothetical protein FRB99_003415 [Tulasnella sp. 403]|nr:hypothetical protein FRB99_003415 [Tulasnella sp. 403]